MPRRLCLREVSLKITRLSGCHFRISRLYLRLATYAVIAYLTSLTPVDTSGVPLYLTEGEGRLIKDLESIYNDDKKK